MKLNLLGKTTFLLIALIVGLSAKTIQVKPSLTGRAISKAIIKARPGDVLELANGVYKEEIIINNGVTVKAKNMHKATIKGDGHGAVVILKGSSSIEGCNITNGTIGIYSEAAGTTIKGNRIHGNWMSGITTVRYLPQIEDNLIVHNRGSAIVGWDTRSSKAVIEHNTIAYNAAFGIYLGGKSVIQCKYNTVAFNGRFGLEASKLSSESTIKYNNFFKNLFQPHENPDGNYSFDPAFQAPRSFMDFTPIKGVCCTIKAKDSRNIGAITTK